MQHKSNRMSLERVARDRLHATGCKHLLTLIHVVETTAGPYFILTDIIGHYCVVGFSLTDMRELQICCSRQTLLATLLYLTR